MSFYLPTRRVPVGTDESGIQIAFKVRGASLTAVTELVQRFGPTLMSLYEKVNGIDNRQVVSRDPETGEPVYATTTAAEQQNMVQVLMADAPQLVATLISICSIDELTEEDARQLPAPVQVDALTKIGELTFATEDGLEKFLVAVSKVMNGFATAVTKVQSNPLDSGSGI